MLELIREILSELTSGNGIVTATIVGHAGSTPRDSGSKMLVKPDGSILGSVGGGILEAKVIRRAVELYDSKGSGLMDFNLSGEEAAVSGMICGGALSVFLEYLPPAETVIKTYETLAGEIGEGRKASLITSIPSEGAESSRVVIGRDGVICKYGMEAGEEFLDRARLYEAAGVLEQAGAGYVVEPYAAPYTAVIIGAGHVGLSTARLAATVGFRTVVVDDREEFANRERFPGADSIHVLESFSGCFGGIEVDENTFIVILTRGHVHDKTVLAQALALNPGYLGMIGSRRKRDAIYEALAAEGVAKERLAAVHSPIGLSISAQTPEEIAVSIVGEMIQVRAGMKTSLKGS